jgi:hypothetical protein
MKIIVKKAFCFFKEEDSQEIYAGLSNILSSSWKIIEILKEELKAGPMGIMEVKVGLTSKF